MSDVNPPCEAAGQAVRPGPYRISQQLESYTPVVPTGAASGGK